MRGHKRFRDGAWRLVVFAGWDPATGNRRNLYETVRAADNRAGAKAADARLAELIAAVEAGRVPAPASPGSGDGGVTVAQLAERWQRAHRPRQDEKTGAWSGWSPKTAKTTADNFRLYLLPALGRRRAGTLTGADLDELYAHLEDERGLSLHTVGRCHSQVKAMFGWGLRKKLVDHNPALSADPVKVKPGDLAIPTMADVRAVQAAAPSAFAAYVQLAATVGARRGTIVALRVKGLDLANRRASFTRAIAESANGEVEKGTKAERPYVVTLGESTAKMLVEHLSHAADRARAAGVGLGPESFVFSDDGGRTHWSLSWPSHAWQRYAAKAGVVGFRLHHLRHTAASQMLMAGVPISIVAERLGCTEANVVRTYRHFIPGSDATAADLMDRLLQGAGR